MTGDEEPAFLEVRHDCFCAWPVVSCGVEGEVEHGVVHPVGAAEGGISSAVRKCSTQALQPSHAAWKRKYCLMGP